MGIQQAMQRGLWIMVAVIVFVSAVGIRGLDADALWDDEIRTYKNAGSVQYGYKTPAQVWDDVYTRTPDVPPGYPIVVSLWAGVAGWSELSTRLISWFAGLLGIALTYRAGADMFSRRIGALAALVVGCSAFYLFFMHEVRAFAVGMSFVALTMVCYWRLVYHRPAILPAVGLALGALGMIYSHYFVALFLPLLAIYHIAFAPKNRRWWYPVGLAIPVVLLFLPSLPIFLRGLTRSNNREALHRLALTPLETLDTLLRTIGHGHALLAVAALLLALYTLRNPYQRRAKLFVLFLGIGMGALIVAVNGAVKLLDPGRQRYFSAAWIPLSLCVALALDWVWMRRRAVGVAAVAVWVSLGLWSLRPTGLTMEFDGADVDDWRAYQRQIQSALSTQDVIALHAPLMPWLAIPYFEHYTAELPVRAELLESMDSTTVMQNYVADAERVWLTVYKDFPAEPQLATFEGVLEDSFAVQCQTWSLPDFDIHLRARSASFCPPKQVIATFGAHTTITGFATSDACAEAPVSYIGWQTDEAVPTDAYSAGLYLFNADDELVAQTDYGLPPPRYGYVRQVLPTADLLPANYTVRTGVYNWQTGERLLTDNEHELITLGTLAIDEQDCTQFTSLIEPS